MRSAAPADGESPTVVFLDDDAFAATSPEVAVARACRAENAVEVSLDDSLWRAPTPDGRLAWWKENRPGRLRSLLRPLVRSRAQREWTSLAALEQEGIPTARPLACLEWRDSPEPRDLLVVEDVPGSRDLMALAADPAVPRSLLLRSARALGRVVRRMHDVGFVHFRLLPRNVLVDPLQPDRVWLIDSSYLRRWQRVPPLAARRFDLSTFCSNDEVPGAIAMAMSEAYVDGGPILDGLRQPAGVRKVARIGLYTFATLTGNLPRVPR